MNKRILIFHTLALLLAVSLSVNAIPVHAYERKEHDHHLEKVLFGNERFSSNKSSDIKNAIKALEAASYLAIDQANGKGADDLDFLKNKFNVAGLPALSDIDFQSGGAHRRYTHMGWNHYYPVDKGNWKDRKDILLSTVNKEFKFKKTPNAVLGHFFKRFREYDTKCDSFCALIYYVHIIGDCMDNVSFTQFKFNYPNMMGLGGRNDKESVIAELLMHTEILFSDQKNSFKYLTLKNKLLKLDGNLKKIVRSEGGINTEVKYRKYVKYARDLMGILEKNIPNLLREEEFFEQVYYS